MKFIQGKLRNQGELYCLDAHVDAAAKAISNARRYTDSPPPAVGIEQGCPQGCGL